MAGNVVAGRIQFKINGEPYNAKGNFTYNTGNDKQDPIVGSDGIHGFKSMPQAPFIQGEITDRVNFDVKDFTALKDATIELVLPTDKVFVLYNSNYTGEGNGETEEGNIEVSFHGLSAETIFL